MKWATPAARAPGTNVSPRASMVSASLAFNRRNGTFCARASRGVSQTSTPPTVNASAPIPAPFIRSRRSIGFIALSLSATLVSKIADVRQYLFAEQFERIHQQAQVTRTRGLEHQIDNARANLVATAFDLADDRVGATKEIRRPRATHRRGSRFAGDIAGVEPRKRLADAGPQRVGVSAHCPRFQQASGFFVGLGQQDIRPIDDLLGPRLPAMLRAKITIVAGRLAHHVERA